MRPSASPRSPSLRPAVRQGQARQLRPWRNRRGRQSQDAVRLGLRRLFERFRAAARRRPRGSTISISATAIRPISATCSKGCSEPPPAAAVPTRPFGGFGQRGRAPQKGADIAYRLKVPFTDAVALKHQRITLADGKTIDLKLPKGVEDGTKIRLAGKGAGRPRRPRRRDRHDRNRAAPLFHARRGTTFASTLPVTLKEAVLGAKVKVPTPEGPVMLTIPKGSSSGKVLRLKGRGFTAKDGKRGDQLVQRSKSTFRPTTRRCSNSPNNGMAAATRAPRLGFSPRLDSPAAT